MATAVISGRVDARLKERADAYLRAAGVTAGDVIRAVWERIARTGEIPEEWTSEVTDDDVFEGFMRFRSELPAATWLSTLSEEQMRDMIASRYV